MNKLPQKSLNPSREELITSLQTPIRAQKKPVTINAQRVPRRESIGESAWLEELGISHEDRLQLLADWCGGEVVQDDSIAIPTKEGTMLARAGDWIIRGVIGEFYPCKPEVFEQTYDLGPSAVDRAATALEEAAQRIEQLERDQQVATAQNRILNLFETALRPNYNSPNACEMEISARPYRLRQMAQDLKPQEAA